MNLGARGLPKFLVKKLGKEKVMGALKKAKPNVLDPLQPQEKAKIKNPKRQPDYFTHQYPNNKAKRQARLKWQAIQDGEREPDPLYSVEEALRKAGL